MTWGDDPRKFVKATLRNLEFLKVAFTNYSGYWRPAV